ncbi:hypothetical protein BT69DRAFT_1355926 [Atractiella rhizophila]|nr:hypothetical protein BT69DRAFT_1355926 [Atractiella rhizophila]
MSLPQREQEGDFTSQVDELIPRVESLAVTNVQEALSALLALEKQTRSASDQPSTTRILLAIVKLLSERKDWKELKEQVQALSKKHGQLRESTKKMVGAVMELLEAGKVEEGEREGVTVCLRDVTEGKIFLELERARLTRRLSGMLEAKGEVAEASRIIQEIAIETFGAVDRREKTSFILEQMRFLKLRGEWEKLEIIARKINARWLAGEGNEDLKLKYHYLLILSSLLKKSYLPLARHYLSIFRTSRPPTVTEPNESTMTEEQFEILKLSALKHALYFVTLAPYDNEQKDLLERLAREEKVVERGEWINFAKCFTTPELMRWPGMLSVYGSMLSRSAVFPAPALPQLPGGEGATLGGEEGGEDGTDYDFVGLAEVDTDELKKGRWEDLHLRVIEHNIRVISTYYGRIRLPRLAQLLSLPPTDTEKHLSRLVIDGMVSAKIDRPAGIVVFKKPGGGRTEETLNVWKGGIEELLGKIEQVGHLIGREYAVKAAMGKEVSA